VTKVDTPAVIEVGAPSGEEPPASATIGQNRVAELDDVLRLIAREVAEILGAGRCSIHLLDQSTSLFRGQVGYSASNLDDRVKKLVSGFPGDRFTHEIIATQKPVMLRNARSDPRAFRVAMRRWNTRSVLGIPIVLRDKVTGILCVDTEGEPFEVTSTALEMALRFAGVAANLIDQSSVNVTLRSEVATVSRQNDLLRRAMAMESRLTKLILNGATLQEVCGAVSDMTGHPAIVCDRSLQPLAPAEPDGGGAELPRIFDPELRGNPVVAEALAAIGDHSTGVIGPFPALGSHERVLFAPIRIGDHVWGYLAVTQRHTALGPLDTVIARRAAANVALELGAEHRTAGGRTEAIESMTAALLHGNYEQGWLSRRCDYLGLRLDARRVVCLVRARGLDANLPSIEALTAAIGSDDLLRTRVAGSLVALLDVPAGVEDEGAWATGRMREVIGAIEARDDLLVATSGARDEGRQIADALLEAKQVMRCVEGHLTGPGDHVVSAEELGAGRLFLAMADPAEARSFAETVVGRLSASDDERSGDLLETLDVFLSTACSARRSAQVLDVHENTIRYRVARIEELTGLAIATDADAQLTAHLALSVFRIGGLVQPSPGSAAATMT
jgi:sugar diacid utilization regulator/GAF domain-containing protein